VRYDPKNASGALPAGEYDATIKSATDGTSRAGNSMQTVVFEVYHGTSSFEVTEYYVDGPALFKYRYLAKALGAGDDFKKGTFDAADYLGQPVRLELRIEEDDEYGDKNRVAKVTERDGAKVTRRPSASSASSPIEPEDIPF
jgi:hypothetical protein